MCGTPTTESSVVPTIIQPHSAAAYCTGQGIKTRPPHSHPNPKTKPFSSVVILYTPPHHLAESDILDHDHSSGGLVTGACLRAGALPRSLGYLSPSPLLISTHFFSLVLSLF